MGAVRGRSEEVCLGAAARPVWEEAPRAGQSWSWLQPAPGNNHHPPKPCQGVRQAGKCAVPGSKVFGKETGSHGGILHAKGGPDTPEGLWPTPGQGCP